MTELTGESVIGRERSDFGGAIPQSKRKLHCGTVRSLPEQLLRIEDQPGDTAVYPQMKAFHIKK